MGAYGESKKGRGFRVSFFLLILSDLGECFLLIRQNVREGRIISNARMCFCVAGGEAKKVRSRREGFFFLRDAILFFLAGAHKRVFEAPAS